MTPILFLRTTLFLAWVCKPLDMLTKFYKTMKISPSLTKRCWSRSRVRCVLVPLLIRLLFGSFEFPFSFNCPYWLYPTPSLFPSLISPIIFILLMCLCKSRWIFSCLFLFLAIIQILFSFQQPFSSLCNLVGLKKIHSLDMVRIVMQS